MLAATVTAQDPQALLIARQGYFFVGGKYFDATDGRLMSGQMYVEFQIPAKVTRPYPLVMFSGARDTPSTYSTSPRARDRRINRKSVHSRAAASIGSRKGSPLLNAPSSGRRRSFTPSGQDPAWPVILRSTSSMRRTIRRSRVFHVSRN
jgi:hypothetical protein